MSDTTQNNNETPRTLKPGDWFFDTDGDLAMYLGVHQRRELDSSAPGDLIFHPPEHVMACFYKGEVFIWAMTPEELEQPPYVPDEATMALLLRNDRNRHDLRRGSEEPAGTYNPISPAGGRGRP